MIEIEKLTKVFGVGKSAVNALNGINIKIESGEIYGIIGLSGAGKSTLVRCINMLEKPTSGKVIVDGQEVTSLPEKKLREARQKIGMIFQHFNLLWSRTVAENIALPLEIANIPKQEIQGRVIELAELVGLTDKLSSYPRQLSGGQKQRVGIARALANHPKVLLCDEATSALDPDTTKQILTLLKEINVRLNITIVIITHEMNVIKEICDRVAVIDNAKIIEEGSVLDVFTAPQSPTAKRFISSVINTTIPDVIKSRSGKQGTVVHLSFIGEMAGEPIISVLMKNFDIYANILYGNIDHIKDTVYGSLVLELIGEEASITQALAYLAAQHLKMEVVSDVLGHNS